MVDLLSLKTDELKALVTYKEVLENGTNFPKNFWKAELSQIAGIKPICSVLTRYCFENIARLKVGDLQKYNLKQLKAFLIEYRLFGMVQIIFKHDVLAVLKNAYYNQFKVRILNEWMWSKHGLWHDDDLIIEAVKDMVRKEGIRWIKDIPTLDWKKRLLKHGIYNLLSYFNWSIYAMFNFVYTNEFHPTDFKYKTKWKASESLDNAFHFMHKTFKKKRYTLEEIQLLSTSAFRRLGFAGMLMGLFGGSSLSAKEHYLYKTQNNAQNIAELKADINNLLIKKQDDKTLKKLKAVAVGKYIYNLYTHAVLYDYIERHAKKNNQTIDEFILRFGFIDKSAKNDVVQISKEELWELRQKRMTYIQIAKELGSNPTTVNELCVKYFGGDPLIPRPIEDYITVQELMNKYHVDHKTVMKLVKDNNFENHTTIRLRYVKKAELEPALKKYIDNNLHHKSMVKRYYKEEN